ncbi:DNA-binding protein Ets97D [Armadillidium nasatum]|uniref:DNA-binding protein Ets97D n=1 Tax=Armadillidium nasatum TaxID=96803 RepID=A0A5N5TNG6_9CRUS|nr:DNA-binding protein Ets97D [Armadillidium nasatum]
MQLWEFLLKLLTDYRHVKIISWIGDNGEFIFIEPEEVARLWGIEKGKMSMSYDTMSRALRYYYTDEKKIIKKKNGRRFVYKFEIDLKNLLGYDSKELQKQLCDARQLFADPEWCVTHVGFGVNTK